MADRSETPHLPTPAQIDAYGNGGFRFADMSHRGSLLCLPDGIWAWPVTSPEDLTEETLAPVFARAEQLDFFVLGTGRAAWTMPAPLGERFRSVGLTVETMQTGAAVRTYNILFGERRRVGAGLLAVD